MDTTKNILYLFLGVIVLVGLAVGSYYLLPKHILAPSQIQNSVAPTKQATPTPDPTIGWPTFTNTPYSYTIKYPQGIVPNEQNTPYYYVEFKQASALSQLPVYVVSVIPDTFTVKDPAAYNYMSADWINNIATVPIGSSKTIDQAASFVRLPNMLVAGHIAQVIEVTATGYKQHRVYIKENGNIYMISNYYHSPNELTDFQNFLLSFKLTI